MDASNMLKPMLARGELHCIGATTLDEYRKHIEKDAALERRFQPVFVGEPTVEDTISILRGLRERYEQHHKVRIKDAALVAAAVLSHRYITDRFLPDKAIDLVDEAASKLRMEATSMPAELDEVRRRIMQLEIEREGLRKEKDPASQERLARIEQELADLKEQATELEARWQRELERAQQGRPDPGAARRGPHRAGAGLAARTTGRRPRGSSTRLAQLERAAERGRAGRCASAARTAARWSRRRSTSRTSPRSSASGPASRSRRLLEGEVEKLIQMEERLRERVVGQDEAITAVANAVRAARAPACRTRTARSAASCSSGRPASARPRRPARWPSSCSTTSRRMVRIDMSEYQEKHTVSRLIGAPPGYVGYDEAGQLTEAVRRRPYSVVLFDEVEKAHPEVLNVLLQLLDDGRLTDGQGRTVDFRNTIVIMTSNLGSQHADQRARAACLRRAPREQVRERVMDAVREHFRPELLNRIDEIVIFHPLGPGADQARSWTIQLAGCASGWPSARSTWS